VFSSNDVRLLEPSLRPYTIYPTVHVFVFDRVLQKLSLISKNQAGVPNDGVYAQLGSISEDGKWAAFVAISRNLVGNIESRNHCYLKNMETGKVDLVSRNFDGSPATGHTLRCQISEDGKTLGLLSEAPALVMNDRNGTLPDLFRWIRETDQMTLVSALPNGDPIDFYLNGQGIETMSRDGNKFIYGRVETTPRRASQLYVSDVAAGVVYSVGSGFNDTSYGLAIANTGRAVFSSFGTDVIPGVGQLQVYDTLNPYLDMGLVSREDNGTPGFFRSEDAAISGDGDCVAFQSASSNLNGGGLGYQILMRCGR
jgi:hypothetical protein